jgi:16S rRNA (guanine966-N2)-methyltransferase
MDQVRLALFNILGSVRAASFLDLYAGSGSVGIDALSRGAALCVFVDSDPLAGAAIRRNLALLALDGEVYTQAAVSWVRAWHGEPFDFVFLDPPYPALAGQCALLGGEMAGLVGKRLICEYETRQGPPQFTGLTLDKQRVYGESALALYTPERAP